MKCPCSLSVTPFLLICTEKDKTSSHRAMPEVWFGLQDFSLQWSQPQLSLVCMGDSLACWGGLHVVTCSVGGRQITWELQKACKNLPTGEALSYLETDEIKERPKKAKGGTLAPGENKNCLTCAAASLEWIFNQQQSSFSPRVSQWID